VKSSDYKYCPRCRSRLRNKSEAFECPHCGMIIYKNSAPTASILIIREGHVLLAKRDVEPFKGEYDAVGGFLKYGEDPITGVLREAAEEPGLKVQVLGLLGIYMDRYGRGGKRTMNFYYVGSIAGGRMRANDDVAELTWFSIDQPPMLAFKSQAKVLRDLRIWLRSCSSSVLRISPGQTTAGAPVCVRIAFGVESAHQPDGRPASACVTAHFRAVAGRISG
jgi:8-oxo-dGTP diphosphatase